jgi:hypothetical protein
MRTFETTQEALLLRSQILIENKIFCNLALPLRPRDSRTLSTLLDLVLLLQALAS